MGKENQKVIQKLNFDELKNHMQQIVPATVLEDNKRILNHLANLYSLFDTEIISNLIAVSLTPAGQIDQEKLQKGFNEFSKSQEVKIDNTAYIANQEVLKAKKANPDLTKEEELAITFQYISPEQLLLGISGSAKITRNEQSIIDDLIYSFRLNPCVANVLLYFVLLQNDMKLNKRYVENLAVHWARKNIQTVQEAMDLAKNEAKKRKESVHIAGYVKEPAIGTEEMIEFVANEIHQLSNTNDKIKEALRSLITKQVQSISNKSESPIEALLAIQLLQEKPFYENKFNSWIRVYQQINIENYRVDLLIRIPQHNINLVIECDGFNFHDRTKEQASADKARDRKLQSLGFYVFRYSGSDIHSDISTCTKEIWEFIEQTIS